MSLALRFGVSAEDPQETTSPYSVETHSFFCPFRGEIFSFILQ